MSSLPLRWLRALIWTLALALPLQALAAAAMLGCGPVAHHGMPAASMEQHHAHGAAHPSHQHDDAMKAQSSVAHQCSACAACCLGAALPSAALSLAAAAGPTVQRAAPLPASLDVVAATPERPPRSFLA